MSFTPAAFAILWAHPESDATIVDGKFEQWDDASGEPHASLGLTFGVQTHCAQNMSPDVYGQLATALPAVIVVRDEIFWQGVYDDATDTFSLPTKVSDYLDAIALNGHQLLLELLWGHVDVTGDTFALPRDAASRTKFCDYASWAIGQVKAKGVPLYGVHIWNEISGSWPGVPGKVYSDLTSTERDDLADDYVLLVQEVRARLTADHPDVRLAAGADVAIQLDWLNRVISRDLLDHCDALDLHPYGGIDNLPAVRSAMGAAGHPDKPIWCTEYSGGGTAAGMVRIAAQIVAVGAELVSYYLAKPHGGFSSVLMDETGAITALGTAYDHMAELLSGANYVSPATVPLSVSGEVFDIGPELVTILWSTGSATVAISDETEIRDVAGEAVAQAPSYDLTDSPLYVFGDSVTVEEVEGGEPVLANFETEFKDTQSAPWEYGYYADETFNLMTWDAANNRWKGPEQFQWIKASQVHPHTGERTTMRIKFAEAKRVRLDGKFRRGATSGDGVDMLVELFDGTSWVRLASGHLHHNEEATYDIVVDVPTEAWIEFSVDAGGSNAFDATGFWVTIYETTAELTEVPVELGSPAPDPTPGGTSVRFIFSADGIVRWQAE